MTETLPRPAPPSRAAPARQAWPPVVAGVLGALRAGLTGLVLVLGVVVAGWAADDRAGAAVADVLRAGVRVWLAAHGTSFDVPPGRFSLAPLGLAALPLALLWRVGRSVARELGVTSMGGAVRAVLVVVAPYAALVAALAVVSGTDAVEPSPTSALLGGSLVGLVGAGAGVLGHERLWRAAWLGRRQRTRRTLSAASTAVAALLGGAALLVGGSLLWHGARTAELFASGAAGPLGGAGLLLAGLAYLPTATVWGACWLAGPGFAVGTGTAVGPFGHELGAVPALPLLAALPGAGLPTWLGLLALAVPLAAGALAGRALHRAGEGLGRTARGLDLVLTAVWAGSAVAVLAALSAGAAGGQRLAELGPSPWRCGLAVALEVGGAAAVTGALLRRRPATAAHTG